MTSLRYLCLFSFLALGAGITAPGVFAGTISSTCVECGFGDDDGEKASELTLEYSGAAGVVTVYRSNKVKSSELLFEGFLSPGDVITIAASTLGKDDLGSKVGFYVDDVFVAEIHTSCSSPLGPGTTEANQEKGKDPNNSVDFTVLSGKDKQGREYCDIPPPPPPPPGGSDCVECGFGADDADKISELTLEYSGAAGIVRVYDNDRTDADDLLFEGFLNPGDTFTIAAATIGEDKFSSKVGFYLDGTSDSDKIAEIHTSCSSPVGFGTTEANQEKGEDPNNSVDFTVLSGKDKQGRELCDTPPPPPPPPGGECVECGFGEDDGEKASQLTLEYSGAAGVVTVYRSNKVEPDELLFEGFLNPGDSFTIAAATVGENDLGSKVGFYLDGVFIAEIHTSCSSPLGPGTTEANQPKGKDPNGMVDFTVTGGLDKQGREYCDIPPPPPPPPPGSDCVECGEGANDADRISELTMRYLGPTAHVTIYDHKVSNGDVLFDGVLTTGQIFTVYASTIGSNRLGPKILMFSGDVQLAEIHTSCSAPVTAGLTEQTQPKAKDPNGVAEFELLGGKDKNGAEICGSDICVTDAGPPVIEFNVAEEMGMVFVDVAVSDDTALETVTFMPTNTNLELVEENFTPGAPTASARFKIVDLALDSGLKVRATDACMKAACDDDELPMGSSFVVAVDDETGTAVPYVLPLPDVGNDGYDRFGRQVSVTDDQGVVYYETFAVVNTFTFLQPDPTCADPEEGCTVSPPQMAVEFVQATEDISMGGRFGLIATDVCNAYVFDPEIEPGPDQGRGVTSLGTNIPAFDATLGAQSVTPPVEFALEQNYPNPFRPTTQIRFALPQAGAVQLVVYDVLGRTVRVLADGEFAEGEHTVDFDATGLASGTYLYRLSSPSGVAVKQMVLAK